MVAILFSSFFKKGEFSQKSFLQIYNFGIALDCINRLLVVTLGLASKMVVEIQWNSLGL